MADGTVIFETDLDGSGFEKGVSSLGTIAKTGAAAAVAAFATIGTALAAASVYAINVGMDFESSMSKVSAISGATGDDFTALENKAKDLGATTQFSASQAADALSYMALAGWDTQEMLSGIDGVMSLAAASGLDLATASDIVTDTMSAFQMEASRAGEAADIFAAASANSNTSVEQLSEAMKHAGAAANAAGMDLAQTSTVLGIFADSGLKGSMAGTTFTSMLTDMKNSAQDGAIAIGDTSVALYDASGNMRDVGAVMADVEVATQGMTTAQRDAALGAIFGTEAMKGVNIMLATGSERYNQLESAIYSSEGAAAKMADTMNDNLKGKMTILESSTEALGIAFYEKLENPLKKAADAGINSINDLTNSMTNGALSGAVETISQGFGSLIETITDVAADGIPILINGFALIIDNSGLIIAALTGVATAFGVMKAAAGISTIVQGLQAASAAAALYGAATSAAAAGSAAAASAEVFLASAMSAKSIIVGVLTGKISLVTAAQWAWNAAMTANPIGLVAAAIGLLVAGLGVLYVATQDQNTLTDEQISRTDKLTSSTNELTSSIESSVAAREKSLENVTLEAEQAEMLAEKIYDLADKQNKTSAEQTYLNQMIEEFNQLVPEANLQLDEQTGALSRTKDETYALIDAVRQHAQEEAIAAAMVENAKAQLEVKMQMRQAQEDLNTTLAEYKTELGDLNPAIGEGANIYAKYEDAILEAESAMNDLSESSADLNQEATDLENLSLDPSGWEEYGNASETALDDALMSIDEFKAQAPEKVNGASYLMGINYSSGISSIPSDTASTFDSATEAASTGAANMGTGVNLALQGMVTGAKEKGTEAANGVAENIAAGAGGAQAAGTALAAGANIGISPLPSDFSQTGTESGQNLAKSIGNENGNVQTNSTMLKDTAKTSTDPLPGIFSKTGTESGQNLAQKIRDEDSNVRTSSTLLKDTAQNSTDPLPGIFSNTGTESGQNLASKIGAENGNVQNNATMLKDTAQSSTDPLPGIFANTGSSSGQNLASNIGAQNGSVQSNASMLNSTAESSVSGLPGSFGSTGSSSGYNLGSGIGSQSGHVSGNSSSIRAGAENALSGMSGAAYSSGTSFGQGLANGIRSMISAVASAAAAIANAASSAVDTVLSIFSPSRVAFASGGYFGEGFELGILDRVKSVSAASKKLANAASSELSSNIKTSVELESANLTGNITEASALKLLNAIPQIITNNTTNTPTEIVNINQPVATLSDAYREAKIKRKEDSFGQ